MLHVLDLGLVEEVPLRHLLVLLDGGEKALVAICIYFAILKVNPAPFVLIDEIEAALDVSRGMEGSVSFSSPLPPPNNSVKMTPKC